MKYFLDSAKIDEIREAYDTFGIDGVTTNPNHIMNSGKPFKTVLGELAAFVKEKDIEGWDKFPISVEINPHLDDADEMVAMAEKIALLGASSCDPLSSPMEARALMDSLLSSANPELTISGKKTMAVLTMAQIDKLF